VREEIVAGEPVIGVTLGDPNGIGPEIAVAAAIAPAGPRLLLIGDAAPVERYARGATVRRVDAGALPQAVPGTIDLVAVDALADGDFAPGHCNAASGRAMIAYTEQALTLCRSGRIDAIAGCPHNETAVHAAGIAFSGYPSLIARLAGLREDEVFLMLVGGGLRIVHATLHERLADALARLDAALIQRAGRAARGALRQLGIAHPRIGLFGINPHAGEDGLFGDDDARITFPAARMLRAEGIDVAGPLGADLMLMERGCDAFIAAYHDQGHIPIKLLAGRASTALTIGTGFVFASVGHGSAPDIAGRGVADAEPLRRTLALLAGMATHRPLAGVQA
jgi:4-hydroxythreonine-4-phosphate dehydrogenase